MNDDAAERANRRKSAHFGDFASVGSSSSVNQPDGKKDGGGRRVVSALAVQAQAGSSSGMTMAQKKAKRLSAVGVAPTGSMDQVLPGVEVNNEKFEEWMKLATDNVGSFLS
jgi:condensin complex subunit 2